MLNNHLVWYFEFIKLMIDLQYGIRKNMSTMGHLFRLENFIKEALIRKEHFILGHRKGFGNYLEIWNHDLGLKAILPEFIKKSFG